jgi:hypothetical protein
MRQRQDEKASSRGDKLQWKPPQVKEGQESIFKVVVLPPLFKGDKCIGKDNEKMICPEDWEYWYFQHGEHYINRRPYPCPRAYNPNVDCPLCSVGFDLMSNVYDKAVRSAIAKEWLSRSSFSANVYFLPNKNSDDLSGKVLWWNVPVKIVGLIDKALKMDDSGDDEDNPQPFGYVLDPEACFPILIKIKSKSDNNTYEDSAMFTKPRSLGDADEIASILSNRVYVPSRLGVVDIDMLKKLADEKLANIETKSKGGFSEEIGNTKSETKVSVAKPAIDDDEVAKPAKPVKFESAKSESVKSESVKSESAKPKSESAKPKPKVADDDDEVAKPTKSDKSSKPAKSADADDDEVAKPVKSDSKDESEDVDVDPDIQKLLATLENK